MLALITASTDPERARACIRSWGGSPFVAIVNGRAWTPPAKSEGEVDGELVRHWILVPEYLGSVAAFRMGVDYALEHLPEADVLACIHDDVEILDPDWVRRVEQHFARHPACGLLGFGGALGLGALDMYQKDYDPMCLARFNFRSNLVDAEVHGIRSLLAEKVACLDGFSQIGRRAFWEGHSLNTRIAHPEPFRPWTVLEQLGIKHHLYDGLLGALAARHGWETWYLPIRCRHLGGQTAVGNAGYGDWAKTQSPGGDHDFWEQAHKIGYEHFRDILPLRV